MYPATNTPADAVETLQAIQEAFDLAYRQSLTDPVVRFDRRSVRYAIAERIIAAALDDGERDVSRLAARARA